MNAAAAVKQGVRAPNAGAAKTRFDAVPGGATPRHRGELARLKKLSVEFESLFMKEAVSAMRKSVPRGGAGSGQNAEEIYRSMLDDHLAASMAGRGDSGIAQAVYNRLSKTYLAVESAKNGGAR